MSQPVFLYDFNSPYAYLAAERIEAVLPEARWQPVAFGVMVRRLGRTPWSFTDERPAGVAEIARRAAARGLPDVRYPDGWPIDVYSLAPLRAALVAEDLGRLREFSHAAFDLFFAQGLPLGDPGTLARAARAAGLDPDVVARGIREEAIKQRLTAATEAAMAAGVTGVPTVLVGDEVFWGDDRLEDAAAAAAARG